MLVFGEDLIQPSRSREMFSVLEAYVDGGGLMISKLLLSLKLLLTNSVVLVDSAAMWGSSAV